MILLIGAALLFSNLIQQATQQQPSEAPGSAKPTTAVQESTDAADQTRAELIARLDAKARAIPVNELRNNLRAYEELRQFDPDNERYRLKVEHYKVQIRIRDVDPPRGFTEREVDSSATRPDVRVGAVSIRRGDPNSWAVVGRVRNHGHRPVGGYVTIKFLDARGDISETHTAYVNGGDPLAPGQAGPFEYWTVPSEFDGVVDFQVLFSEM